MKLKSAIAVGAALCAAIVLSTGAEAGRIKPGLWRLTARMVATGMKPTKPMSTTTCVTPKQAAREIVEWSPQYKNCKLSNIRTTPHSYSADGACRSSGTIHFDYRFHGQGAYTATIVMTSGKGKRAQTLTNHLEGQWISDRCAKRR